MKWHKVYLRKMTEEENVLLNNIEEEVNLFKRKNGIK